MSDYYDEVRTPINDLQARAARPSHSWTPVHLIRMHGQGFLTPIERHRGRAGTIALSRFHDLVDNPTVDVEECDLAFEAQVEGDDVLGDEVVIPTRGVHQTPLRAVVEYAIPSTPGIEREVRAVTHFPLNAVTETFLAESEKRAWHRSNIQDAQLDQQDEIEEALGEDYILLWHEDAR